VNILKKLHKYISFRAENPERMLFFIHFFLISKKLFFMNYDKSNKVEKRVKHRNYEY